MQGPTPPGAPAEHLDGNARFADDPATANTGQRIAVASLRQSAAIVDRALSGKGGAAMKIAKPFRILIRFTAGGIALAVTHVVLKSMIGLWSIPCALGAMVLANQLADYIVNRFDFMLRRVSRDPIWVMQHGTDADPDDDRREGV
jgi:hypothetical protein